MRMPPWFEALAARAGHERWIPWCLARVVAMAARIADGHTQAVVFDDVVPAHI